MDRCEYCGRRNDRPGSGCDGSEPHTEPDLSQKIVEYIETDLTDRKGLKQVWWGCDEDTLDEIRDEWARLVREATNDQ